MATKAEIAAHLDLSHKSIQDLIAKGVLEDAKRGQMDLDACRVAYIRNLRARAAGRGGSGKSGLDLNDERARKAKEEADQIEMKNAERRGELVERGVVDAAVIGAFARVKTRLLAIPPKVAPLLTGMDAPTDVEPVVRKYVEDALAELAATNVGDLCGGDEQLVEGPEAAAEADGQ